MVYTTPVQQILHAGLSSSWYFVEQSALMSPIHPSYAALLILDWAAQRLQHKVATPVVPLVWAGNWLKLFIQTDVHLDRQHTEY